MVFIGLNRKRPVDYLNRSLGRNSTVQGLGVAVSNECERVLSNRTSPQSNGLAESLAKTFKRDCVMRMDPLDASAVAPRLSEAFEHYNEVFFIRCSR